MPARPKLYIRGLVRARRLVEQRLRRGVLPGREEAELRDYLGELTARVEELCRQHGLRVADLPAPSRNAYSYFQDLLNGRAAIKTRPLPPPDPRLQASFERVNRAYFEGKMQPPLLAWTARRTRREFGRYIPGGDLVTVSRSLAETGTPDYVLDYIMYHELLHKQMGFRRVNGRSYSHTTEFRQAERRYARYQEARAYLERLARGPVDSVD
ncbi:MAG TPA: M48 family metallopeptidase [Chloroflexi bacterium]|nr:M48 family metallopeptidase [Chloroflexota bacterium]HPO57725.1 hypothetical protein [Anaerolineaceae bacterium]